MQKRGKIVIIKRYIIWLGRSNTHSLTDVQPEDELAPEINDLASKMRERV